MTEIIKENKLTGRDLITLGILNAIMFVVMFVCAFIGIVPILNPFYTAVMALINGVVFVLLFSKVPKTGVFIITCFLQTLYFAAVAGPVVLIPTLVIGVLGELLLFKKKKLSRLRIAYPLYTLNVFLSNFGLFYVMREWYVSYLLEGYGQEYVDTLVNTLLGWLAIVAIVATIVCAVIGVQIGIAMFKKHFKKAGIA